jgi:hypothetical protein
VTLDNISISFFETNLAVLSEIFVKIVLKLADVVLTENSAKKTGYFGGMSTVARGSPVDIDEVTSSGWYETSLERTVLQLKKVVSFARTLSS